MDGAPSLLGLLTLAAGLAVAEGVGHATGLEASLKWPNDLFYGYKLAGVLAEGHRIGTPEQHVVVGVGINIRDVPYVSERERATSIETELGRAPDAGAVLAEVLAAWAGRYQDLLDGRYARVVDRWRIRATGLAGRPVAWVDAARRTRGHDHRRRRGRRAARRYRRRGRAHHVRGGAVAMSIAGAGGGDDDRRRCTRIAARWRPICAGATTAISSGWSGRPSSS